MKYLHLLTLSAATVLILAVYSANTPLWLSSDNAGTKYLPLSLLSHRGLTLDNYSYIADKPSGNLIRTGGHWRSAYPIGTALLALPLYVLLPKDSDASVDNSAEVLSRRSADIMTALTVLLLTLLFIRYHRSRIPGNPVAPTLLFMIASGLGTPLWSICSDDLWQHTGSVLMVSAALLFLGTEADRDPWIREFLAGSFFGFSAVCRPTNLIFIPVYAAWIFRRRLVKCIAFAAGAVSGILPLLAYNLSVFGSFTGGYGGISRQVGWGAPDLHTALNLLVHPSTGLFVFSPVTLLIIPGLLLVFKKPADRFLTPAALCLAAQWLLISCWRIWDGGICYGPRLMSDAIPFAAVLMMPALSSSAGKPLRRTLIFALAALSAAIQAAGAFWYDGSYTFKNSAAWIDSEIAYTVSRGRNEIMWPLSAQCIPPAWKYDLKDPSTEPMKRMGIHGTRIDPLAVLAVMSPESGIHRVKTDVSIDSSVRFSEACCRLRLNGTMGSWAAIESSGKILSLEFDLPVCFREDGINSLEMHVRMQRSSRFSFIRGSNTLRSVVGDWLSLSLIRD